MKKYLILLVVMFLGACVESTTAPLMSDDYALVVFGAEGSALEGTMGTQLVGRPFDGRTGARPFPDSLKLSQTQLDSIRTLRETFRVENKNLLDTLKVVFEQARTTRQNGATRQEIVAILAQARTTQQTLRPLVKKLHEDIFAVFTPAQKAWVTQHRRVRP
jgi:Spy/CpxP family protein refolding chaperone